MYPSFDDALNQFQAFAREQGGPWLPLFLKPEDAVVTGQFVTIRRPPEGERIREARQSYDEAVKRGLGVELAGFVAVGGLLGCYVYSPTGEREAEESQMPDGLKLSVRKPLMKGSFAGPILWAILRWRESGHAE